MRRFSLLVSVLALLVLASPLVVAAQEDPGALLKKLADLDNAKDENGIVGLFAADGVIVSPSPDEIDKTRTYTGTDEIRQWVKMDIGGDASDDRVELGQVTVQGDTASAPFKNYSNDTQMKQAGLDPITGVAEVTAKDGKIAKFTITIDQEWMKKAQAVMAAQGPGAAAATPGAAGEATGPGKLPATGEARDPLPLALTAGLVLLVVGLALRRSQRAI